MREARNTILGHLHRGTLVVKFVENCKFGKCGNIFLILEMALNLRFWEIRIKVGTFLEFYKFRKNFLHGRTIRAPEISKLVNLPKRT